MKEIPLTLPIINCILAVINPPNDPLMANENGDVSPRIGILEDAKIGKEGMGLIKIKMCKTDAIIFKYILNGLGEKLQLLGLLC